MLSCQVKGCVSTKDLSTASVIASTMDIERGSDFSITCCLENQSSCLRFKEENNYTSPYQITKQLDESTIILTQNSAEEGKYVFVCVCDGKGVQRTMVFVGTRPKGIAEFECVVFDFIRMECTLKPHSETIFTQYTIAKMSKKQNQQNVFEISGSQYQQLSQFFSLEITSSNSLANLTETKIIDQYTIVKPKLPDVKIENITTNAVTLSWNIYNYATYEKYTNGLEYEIYLEPKGYKRIKIDSKIQNFNTNFTVNISDLYSYMEYTIHFRVKANKTINKETLWSDKLEKSFKTLPSPPSRSPIINIGCFYIHANGKAITLFWRDLLEHEKQGPDFNYQFLSIKQNGTSLNPTLKMGTTSALMNIDWRNTSSYEFELHSQNKIGLSSSASILKINPRIPSISHEKQIEAITKIYHETNQTYTVSWLKPSNFSYLSSFTIFWCEASTGSKNQCTSSLNFEILDKNTFNYNRQSNNMRLNFALSENYFNNSYSSGIMWAMCSPDTTVELSSIELNKITKRTDSSITIQWYKKCWHTLYVDEYILTYCSKMCDQIVIPKDVYLYEIKGLDPSTLYNITIQTFANGKYGKISDFLLETTTEAHDGIRYLKYICLSILIFVLVILVIFYLRSKYREMKKIGVILPTFNKENKNITESFKKITNNNKNFNETNIYNNFELTNDETSTYKQIKDSDERLNISVKENDLVNSCPKEETILSKHSNYVKSQQVLDKYVRPSTLSGLYVTPRNAALLFVPQSENVKTIPNHYISPINATKQFPVYLKPKTKPESLVNMSARNNLFSINSTGYI